jgi:hypothetical protein
MATAPLDEKRATELAGFLAPWRVVKFRSEPSSLDRVSSRPAQAGFKSF